MLRLVSLAGIVAFAMIAWALSEQRRRVPWRTVLVGLALQLAIGALVFLAPPTRALLLWLNDGIAALLGVSLAGARYVFGPLVAGPGQPGSIGFVLAFQVLPIAVFFSALTAAAYRLGVLQPIVRAFGWLFHRTLRISGAEAMSSAANLVVGVESALAVRPYLARMTRSELLVVLATGMATVASTVLGLYMFTLQGVFPAIGGHLISATVISIPAAIVVAKLLIPESAVPETIGVLPPQETGTADGGVMAAVLAGAMEGVRLAVGIAAGLIAILGLVALVDVGLAAVSRWLQLADVVSLTGLLGAAFTPLAALLGLDAQDIRPAARLLGVRAVQTEFVAFQQLAGLAAEGALTPRTVVIMSYALCGFAHLASLAIFVGGTAALVPERRRDLAGLGMKALIAATLATLMTAAVAGVFCSGDETAFTASRG